MSENDVVTLCDLQDLMRKHPQIYKDHNWVVDRIDCQEEAGSPKRLLDLGFLPNSTLKIEFQAPFGGDPLAVRVGDSLIALRRHDAKNVIVRIERSPDSAYYFPNLENDQHVS